MDSSQAERVHLVACQGNNLAQQVSATLGDTIDQYLGAHFRVHCQTGVTIRFLILPLHNYETTRCLIRRNGRSTHQYESEDNKIMGRPTQINMFISGQPERSVGNDNALAHWSTG